MDLLNDLDIEFQSNKVKLADRPFHDWYRFVLSFPPHLVKNYLDKFDVRSVDLVLDPFTGTGTTLIESKLNGFNAVGLEANPIIKYITDTKLRWNVRGQQLMDRAGEIFDDVTRELNMQGIDDGSLSISNPDIKLLDLPTESKKILLTNSISPIPLHKALTLLKRIQDVKDEAKDFLLVAFLKTVVKDVSNLRFGPEIGLGKIRDDAKILEPWLNNVRIMTRDLESIDSESVFNSAKVFLGDSRNASLYLEPKSIGAVITSPPYPNEKDYSRTTRLESVLLGHINNMIELRKVKKTFVRSNTRSVYKEDTDHQYIQHIKSVIDIAKKIEDRRIELNKTSGFEKMYSKVTLQYFGGMARHLSNLQVTLKKGAKLAYVVGDQASFFRVMIKTGELLGEIAESQGYKVLDLELFRKRFATASKQDLREEVLILQWNG